jgi:5,10-methylenetetrahydromethanopterin reductase
LRLGTIALWGDDLEVFRHQLHLAEDLGYSVIGVGDSPSAWHDMVVSLAIAAAETTSATLTPLVTAPFLRHPSVLANTISSIDDLSGGRAALGIGSGGSALRSVGRTKATRQDDMGSFVVALRSLLDGGVAEFEGRTTARLVRARRVPLLVSADGPRGLRLAGELADGVIFSTGLSLDLVDRKIATIRDAAAAAGRDPSSIDLWGLAFTSVRPTREEANADITAFLASTAGMGLKAPHMRAIIPPELLSAVEEIERRYDPTEHVVVGGSNARLLEELGLVDFVVGLNSITGTPQQVSDHLRALEDRGVSCVLAPLPGSADPDGTLERLAEAAAQPSQA